MLAKYFLAVPALAIAAFGKPAKPVDIKKYTHESVPGYQLDSVNPASLGLDKVKQQAGYLGTPSGDRIFYWFFESRGDASTDPVVVWLNGGPGCSSLEAILFENGPVNIDAQNKLTHNPYSWNAHANVLYIDNPAGVGYSTSTHSISDSISASEDFKNAIRLFFFQHPEFQQNGFHIAGESYAGRYIPVFASAINGDPQSPVKVASVLIGNGLVNPVSEYAAYQPMLCGQGGYSSVLSPGECQQLQDATPQCLNAMNRCMDSLNFDCSLAQLECNPIQGALNGLNPYDIRDSSCTPSQTGLCYPVLDNVQAYFNNPTVRHALGADQYPEQFKICNNAMNEAFYAHHDPYAPTFKNVTSLLEERVPVLIYNGDADIILNWLGARQWTAELQWPGQAGFQQAGTHPVDWNPTGNQKLGEITNFENFTFLRVAGAGHMVPHDQPESAYYMVNSWLRGDHAFKEKY